MFLNFIVYSCPGSSSLFCWPNVFLTMFDAVRCYSSCCLLFLYWHGNRIPMCWFIPAQRKRLGLLTAGNTGQRHVRAWKSHLLQLNNTGKCFWELRSQLTPCWKIPASSLSLCLKGAVWRKIPVLCKLGCLFFAPLPFFCRLLHYQLFLFRMNILNISAKKLNIHNILNIYSLPQLYNKMELYNCRVILIFIVKFR